MSKTWTLEELTLIGDRLEDTTRLASDAVRSATGRRADLQAIQRLGEIGFARCANCATWQFFGPDVTERSGSPVCRHCCNQLQTEIRPS